ncbi:MAG: L-threonylcarbamoyladenylate synthase [Patescibacteria group bacterium]|nr:L-threonylcarbamoyladenylate synthase [Patescibacteria group bacterium]
MKRNLEKAVKTLKQGGIVIFPSDTTFVISCRIDNDKAVGKLFKIKKRSKDKAVLVLADSLKMAQVYVENIDKDVKNKLIKKFWPGPLTIVFKANLKKVSGLIRGGGNTLGVRIPDHKISQLLIQGVGVPLLGPSANFQGEKTPFRIEDLDNDLISLVDFVLPGATNNYKKASTVIDCSVKPWKIIRKGAARIDPRILN